MDPLTEADFGRLQLVLMQCMEQADRDGNMAFRRAADEAGVWEQMTDFAEMIRQCRPSFTEAIGL